MFVVSCPRLPYQGLAEVYLKFKITTSPVHVCVCVWQRHCVESREGIPNYSILLSELNGVCRHQHKRTFYTTDDLHTFDQLRAERRRKICYAAETEFSDC